MYIYIYIYMYTYMSLSLSLYIYIYFIILFISATSGAGWTGWHRAQQPHARAHVFGNGRGGSALMGSLRLSCFWQRGFLGTPVNLLLSSQKCQGVPFLRYVKICYFCSGAISVDPICPQPTYDRSGDESDTCMTQQCGHVTWRCMQGRQWYEWYGYTSWLR